MNDNDFSGLTVLHNLEHILDIENFSQCLSYMSLASNSKNFFGTVFPLVTTLIGVGIGFFLNQVTDHLKNKKSLADKKLCIDEEVCRTRQGLEHVFKESLEIIDQITRKERPLGHNFPPEIDTPFIDEYFTAIAHSYKQSERHLIQSVRPTIRELKKRLKLW